METFIVVGAVANALQFITSVDSLVLKVPELRQSATGTLAEYKDLEKITIDLSILCGRLPLSVGLTDSALESLCSRCAEVAGELSVALKAVAIKKNRSRSQIWGTAIRSVWRKEKLQALERRLAGFRQELILHVTVDLGARIDLLGVGQKEQLQQLGEAGKRETDHILEVLRELTDQFTKATEDQSEGNQILHAGTQRTLTRRNESATVHAEEQHKETRTIIADENQKANKSLLHALTDLASAQDQAFSVNPQSICAKIDSASESLLSQMNTAGELNREEMKQQFVELRRSIEKVREAYHQQSNELKETAARMNTLADGPPRQTLKAKANSITVALLSFREIYKTLRRMMRQLLQRAEKAFGARTPKLWAHAKTMDAQYKRLPDHVGYKVSLSMHYPDYYGPHSSIPRSYFWGSLVLAGVDRLTK